MQDRYINWHLAMFLLQTIIGSVFIISTHFTNFPIVFMFILATKITNRYGTWSSSGCKQINGNDPNFVFCECDHMTNFALLLDVSQTGSNPFVLHIVTWIGSGISLFGLAVTIITHLAFR